MAVSRPEPPAPPSPPRKPQTAKPVAPKAPPPPVAEMPADDTATWIATIDIPLPERNPALDKSEVDKKATPKAPPHPSKVVTEDWTLEDKKTAKAACKTQLAGLAVSYEFQEPLHMGICGAPAPIRLAELGAAPNVEIRPAATVTCHMAAGLVRWMDEVVQPAARKHLGAPVVSIRNVASYSCRNRYNAPGRRISEHANANALDIASFETSTGQTVTVLQDWNAREKIEGDGKAKETVTSQAPETAPQVSPVSATKQIAVKTSTKTNKASRKAQPESSESEPVSIPAAESKFLREAFDGACKIFGTTLGPEANAAHRDHFHLDMKERRYGGYCE